MKKIGSQISAAYYFLRYLVVSHHRNGHGVHSPFVFDFINEVVFNRTNYSDYQFFGSVISSLKSSEEKIHVENFGEDSLKFKAKYRKVSDLVRISSIPMKYGRLLYRISKYYEPATVVELGTSIGLSTLFLAKGSRASKLLTVEGNKALSDFASGLFRQHQLKNIKAVKGDFDQVILRLPSDFASPQLVFIDGNHKYEPSMRYFRYFKEKMKEGIIIIDDIYWSAGMRKAWREIVQQNLDCVTIDLYRMGIIFVRDSITPGHYVVRF